MNARIAVFLVAAALLAAGCGSSEGSGDHPNYAKALAGAPPPLAALYEQGDELLDGGVQAYERRLRSLRGYPVVVNVWASWCGPCRFEFPYFQRAAARYGKRVAFLGIDKEDSEDLAGDFLSERPLPYPSYIDPDEEIAESVDREAGRGVPTTAFYDRAGELTYLKLGPYDEDEEPLLRADIERYALGGGGKGG